LEIARRGGLSQTEGEKVTVWSSTEAGVRKKLPTERRRLGAWQQRARLTRQNEALTLRSRRSYFGRHRIEP
jgi:hypothetical protein